MKLTLDFEEMGKVKITASDDPDNFYLIGILANKYSLWYNDSFVWEKEFETTGYALGLIVGSIVDAMEVAVS